MKKLFILFVIQQFSFNLFAQSGTMLPDGFILPNSAMAGTCSINDKGKMYFNTTTQNVYVCDGTTWKLASSPWNEYSIPTSYLSYNGKVGINTSTPAYDLDVNGDASFMNDLLPLRIGVGTTNPGSALEIVDGDLAISSTADAKTWKFDYNDASNALTLQENGAVRMIFANGGNIGIGSSNPTSKLSVDGTGNFAGDLTVNAGKGIVRSTTATQLKCHIAQASLGAIFTVNAGLCATSNVNLTSASFSAAPTAQIGNLVSGTGDFGKLVIIVQSTTATQAVVRFCNNTATNITLSSMVFNLLCLGQ